MDENESKPGCDYHWQELLDKRQLQEVKFAQLYTMQFAHGTDGHNRLMLINLLVDALNRVEASGVDIKSIAYPMEDN